MRTMDEWYLLIEHVQCDLPWQLIGQRSGHGAGKDPICHPMVFNCGCSSESQMLKPYSLGWRFSWFEVDPSHQYLLKRFYLILMNRQGWEPLLKRAAREFQQWREKRHHQIDSEDSYSGSCENNGRSGNPGNWQTWKWEDKIQLRELKQNEGLFRFIKA